MKRALVALMLASCQSGRTDTSADPGALTLEMASSVAGGPACCAVTADRLAKGIKTMTVNQSLACCIAFAVSSCGPINPPPVPPTPIGTGGSVATGGASGTGGSVATGGAPAPVFPACSKSMKSASPMGGEQRKFGPPTKPRAKTFSAIEAAPVTGPSVRWNCNVSDALDQDGTGSCTGFDAAMVASTKPYARALTNADGLACYSAATKLDNGCTWNASTCKGAYPPNDTGSWATSSFRAATYMGWFTGTRPVVQTVQGWHDALLQGPCGFDQNWYNDGFSTDTCGRVAITGALAGGHSTAAIGFDVANQRMWLRNSWSNSFGVENGFFYYTVADLQSLWLSGAEMVCPEVP